MTKSTYQIVNSQNQVLFIDSSLERTKYAFLISYSPKTCFIRCIKGQHFGEGFHWYELRLDEKTLRETKKRWVKKILN
jgi:hypothetical protein